MARITDTILFKSIAPRIKSISKRELAKQLAIVKRSFKKKGDSVNWFKTEISSAFVWDETPQDYPFWSDLDGEMRRYRK